MHVPCLPVRGPARLILALAIGLMLLAPAFQTASAAEEPQPLDPLAQPKFVHPLPNPLAPGFVFQPDGTVPGPNGPENLYLIGMFQTRQDLGLVDATGQPLPTTVWGYGKSAATATFPGRTFVARRDTPINVYWANGLVDELGRPLPHLLPIDETLHWAMPMMPPYPASGVPLVTHLHGGHTESASDGLPEAWFTPGFAQTGRTFVKDLYHYDNDQEAGTLWYHDHALGITRLNVYAGLAGFYLLRDAYDTGERDNPLGLPAYPYEVPIVIQDRMFTAGGQLFYPAEPEDADDPNPSVEPEFFGDFILVNGVAWPVLEVEPRLYRLRFLNGSDSRFYTMRLATGMGPGPDIVQIGTDDGLLYAPVPLTALTIGPGERADTIVDFSAYAGQTLILRNNARAPYPKGEPVDPLTTGQLMAFRVGGGPVEDPGRIPATLRPLPIEPLVQSGATRRLVLFEREDEFGRLMPSLGTVEQGALDWDAMITENPMLNDVEVWEIYNATPDAHPIHQHLVSFQIIDRQKYRAHVGPNGELSGIRLLGRPSKPDANEAGWKDTAQMFPREVTRVIARYDRAGRYVWHCHILSHEDHEMMRPFCVGDLAACLP
jgi:spore coat protein A, manganese oxidase